jgi:hypothetical protein
MSPFFFITSEPKGVHMIERTEVRPDFMFRPRSDLLERGFEDIAMVVEVKSVHGSRSVAKPWFRAVRACWQAASYVQSEFDGIRPAFGVVFPDFDIFLRAHLRENGNQQDNWLAYKTLVNFANFAGVGCIQIRRTLYSSSTRANAPRVRGISWDMSDRNGSRRRRRHSSSSSSLASRHYYTSWRGFCQLVPGLSRSIPFRCPSTKYSTSASCSETTTPEPC